MGRNSQLFIQWQMLYAHNEYSCQCETGVSANLRTKFLYNMCFKSCHWHAHWCYINHVRLILKHCYRIQIGEGLYIQRICFPGSWQMNTCIFSVLYRNPTLNALCIPHSFLPHFHYSFLFLQHQGNEWYLSLKSTPRF